MEIKTKYNIGDRVWYKEYNGVISRDEILSFSFDGHYIRYRLMFDDEEIEECNLFPTKEELLASLK